MAIYNFSGKIILVTGAGAGIGKAIVRKLVSCGAQVVALSLLQSELDSLQKELPGIRTVQADLREWDAAKNIVSGLGPIDGLVNCAGVAIVAPFLEVTEEQFDLTYSINVKAVINVSQVVAKSMIERNVKGSIVNISSIAALTSLSSCLAYCGSKGAVQATTRVMASELGKHGIRVNTVNPTVVKTELSRFIWDSEATTDYVMARTPLGRFAEVGDIANATAFLLSDEASMINGTGLVVDGGFLKALHDHTIYCASKASVDAVTKVTALELGPHGIRVNSINPTVVLTELGKKVWSDPEKCKKLIRRIPMGRFAEEDEVVSGVLFLLSEESVSVTGTCLRIDGGFEAN